MATNITMDSESILSQGYFGGRALTHDILRHHVGLSTDLLLATLSEQIAVAMTPGINRARKIKPNGIARDTESRIVKSLRLLPDMRMPICSDVMVNVLSIHRPIY